MLIHVRLVRRLACRLAVRLVSCVPLPLSVVSSVVPSHRLGLFRLSSRMGAVSFCCSLVLVSFAGAVLPCVPVPFLFLIGIPFVPRLARRLVVASRTPSRLAHLVLARHLVLVVRGGVRVRFHVRSRVRTVPPCSSLVPVRSSVSVPTDAVGGGVRRRGEAAGLALLVSCVPSHSYSLLAHSLRGLRGGWGYGAPFHAARRSFIASHVLIVSPISSISIVLIRSHFLIHKSRKATEAKKKAEEND